MHDLPSSIVTLHNRLAAIAEQMRPRRWLKIGHAAPYSMMRIFIAGIMQGSLREAALHAQDYRPRLRELLQQHLPRAEVYDPLTDHGESLAYDHEVGRAVFLRHNQMCAECDLVIAFVPEASMGTAIEIWEAHRAGRKVVTISPLAHNWAVKFLSDVLYETIDEFEADLISGRLASRLS